jgi:DNA-binding NarL/FixJ family response regulator
MIQGVIMARANYQDKKDRTKARIIIVDDHPIVRQGLSDLINREKDLEVCAQAEYASQALKAIETLDPDMVIVDISLKEGSGLDLIRDIKIRFETVPALVLSMHPESIYAERALRAGAKGYIMKQEPNKEVIGAIRKVLDGALYLSDKIMQKLVYRLVDVEAEAGQSLTDRLSDRELEVFGLLGRGNGTRQIADKLHLSVKTVDTYRTHIKEKLNLENASELQHHAFLWVNSMDQG